jgi:acyl-coenzyme A synthetase/AMP-(fatty) acid ligase
LNYDSEAFSEDGWYCTGDIVEQDEDGYIKIIGRKSDIINVGGLKVYPNEVESIIEQIDGVLDVFVFGKENSISGNIVCAKIVSKSNNFQEQGVLKKQIRKVCQEKLEKFKVPAMIIFNDLKINDRGKRKR